MSREINVQIENLAVKLQRRQVVGSYNVALDTARLLRNVVAASRWSKLEQLLTTVKEMGAKLQAAQPIELAVGNMVKRVVHLITEEHKALKSELTKEAGGSDEGITDASMKDDLKAIFKQSISEMIDELETAHTTIAAGALEHIHSGEIIMTVGRSRTVENFLKEAAKHRKFQVIIAETAPFYQGHDMMKSLKAAGLDVAMIPDAAVFGVMSRINKVILGAHAVTANGAIVAISGSHAVAAAAKYHSTPVVVCSGLYKVSPSYPYNSDIYSLCVSPDPVYPFEEDMLDRIDVVNPYFDFVAPENVSLIITNMGSHPPSFIQRLISESYGEDDMDFL
ncbi:Translation initiation factor eIF-2B subunit beta [Borealophlyctis nickersoniae]|nr:Translation initiation factor eIF-2B subunit beta [Borealophlyctis nickersoniae]